MQRDQAYDAKRRLESETRKLYGTQRWRRKAAHQLLLEPLCRLCHAAGRITAATIADHIIPHMGDVFAFWNNALQSLCKACHDGVKQREERRGHSDALGADGWPSDPRHPANAGGTQAATQGAALAHPEAPGGIKCLEAVAPRPAANLRAQSREMKAGGRNNG